MSAPGFGSSDVCGEKKSAPLEQVMRPWAHRLIVGLVYIVEVTWHVDQTSFAKQCQEPPRSSKTTVFFPKHQSKGGVLERFVSCYALPRIEGLTYYF